MKEVDNRLGKEVDNRFGLGLDSHLGCRLGGHLGSHLGGHLGSHLGGHLGLIEGLATFFEVRSLLTSFFSLFKFYISILCCLCGLSNYKGTYWVNHWFPG